MAISLVGVVAMGWSFLLLSFIFVVMRLYVRWYLQGFAVQNAVSTYITSLEHWKLEGFGAFFQHPSELYHFAEVNKGISIPYIIALYAIKGSFLLFYHQLFPTSFKKLRFGLYVTTFPRVACFFTSLLIECLMCNTVDLALMAHGIPPRYALWRYKLYKPAYLGGIAQDMVTDILVYILPLFILPTLQLNSRRKMIGLAITFSVGLLVVVCTITRLVSKKWIDRPTDTAFIISNTQLCAGIIVACLPPLRWLYHSFKYARRTAGRVTVASATDSQRDCRARIVAKAAPESDKSKEKISSDVVATRTPDSAKPSAGGKKAGIKGGWGSIRTTMKSRASTNTNTVMGSGVFGGVTFTAWDPDEGEILERFGEYDEHGAVPVPVTSDEGSTPEMRSLPYA